MRDIAVTVIVFGVLLMTFKYPHYGIYLWSWLSYMNPHRQGWGFAYDFPYAFIVAIVTLVAYLLSREPKRIQWTPEMALLIAFNLWIIISSIFAFFPDAAWHQWNKVWKIQLMTLVTMMLITDRKRINGLVWVIVLSLGYYGVKGGAFTIATGGGYHVYGPAESFIGGNNEIALALVMIVPLIRYLHLQVTHRWEKFGLAAAMLLTAVAAIGSQSRGALLALVAMGVFLWFKSRHKLGTGTYALIAVVVVAMFMPQTWYERIASIQDYEEDASAMGRINAWHTAFNVATDRITGGGFDMWGSAVFSRYAPNPLDVHDVHSIYFEILGEHGFVGLALWLAVAFIAWWRANKVISACKGLSGKQWAADLAGMIQVSLVGYAVGGAFLGLAYFDLYYHLIALIILTHQVSLKEAGDPVVVKHEPYPDKPLPHPSSRWGT
jgi:probable O-glycosylation ligase (exosortase A-associated)